MSIFFDLDTAGRRAEQERALLNPLDPSQLKPEGLEGAGEAMKGFLRPAASQGRTIMMAGSVLPLMIDQLSSIDAPATTDAQDWYFDNVVDDAGNSAVDFWTPDPNAMGGGAKFLSATAQLGGTLPFILAGPGGQASFLADAGIGSATDAARQGASTEAALGVGAINLAANAIGLQLPAAIGSTLTQKVTTGVTANVALGTGSDAANAAVLRADGQDELAASYNWADPTARTMDVMLGAVFGAIAPNSPVTSAQRDAVLAARANANLTRGTAPGEPLNATGQRQHVEATQAAIEALARGEPVNVAATIDPANFRLPEPPPPAAVAPGAATGDYVAYRRALESGGRADARNPNSTATGADQFTEGTWLAMVERERPAWAEGLSREQLLAERTNPERSGEMAAALDRANAQALTREGLPATVHNLYAAHHFGEAGGIAFAKAAPDTPVASILTPEQIQANPYLRGKTKAEVLAGWDKRATRAGVATPVARAPFASPDELATRQLDAVVERFSLTPEAREAIAPQFVAPRDGVTGFIKVDGEGVFDALIARAQQHVAATGEPATYVSADVFNLGGLNAAVGERQAEANVHYRAMAQIVEAELRSTGADVVPVRSGGDEFGLLAVNLDAPDTRSALDRAQVKLREYVEAQGLSQIPRKGQTDPTGVGLHLGASDIRPGESPEAPRNRADDEMSQSKERRRVPRNPAEPPAEALPGRAAGAASVAGRGEGGSGEGAAGGRGADASGQPEPAAAARAADDALTEVRQVAAENPDATVIVGADETGAGGKAVTLAEALDDIETERAQAEREASGLTAAVSCFLRRGATA